MSTLQEKLVVSLELLKDLQEKNELVAITPADLSRVHRTRLVKYGFLKEVIKGWYIITPPDEREGDSTSWYASYWKFAARYLQSRYGVAYCISAEHSLQLHVGNKTIPQQLIVRAQNGSNSPTPLPHGTSMFSMQSPLPLNAEIISADGLRMLTLPSALVNVTATFFQKNAIDARAGLSMIRDASEILPLLLNTGRSTIAGRLAGAFRNNGQSRIADEILKTMRSADYDVRESDPFEAGLVVELSQRESSPHSNRVRLLWYAMREEVLRHFPVAPGIPKKKKRYLKQIKELFVTDAYHSLSIENYIVTPALIEKVRTGAWDSKKNHEDRQQRDAMAARGYYKASEVVYTSVERVLKGENPGTVANEAHGDWFRELFSPSVAAGFLKPADLAGYRREQVFIAQSKHLPLDAAGVRDAMPELFRLIALEPEAAVRAVLGHFLFVFIHPYSDGNGRIGRFLMNLMLASGGYPWTVIPVEERDTYMNALEDASVKQDIEAFAKFIAHLVKQAIKGKPVAKI